jgi:hypothetical protein
MGIGRSLVSGPAVLTILCILFSSGCSMNVQAQSWLDNPVIVSNEFIDAEYEPVNQVYKVNMNEKVLFNFDVEIRNYSKANNLQVHIYALLFGFEKQYNDHDKDQYQKGQDVKALYEKTKDEYSSDFKGLSLQEILEHNITTFSVNFTFRTAGLWEIKVLYEMGPDKFYLEENTADGLSRIWVMPHDNDPGFYSLFAVSFAFISLAVVLDMIQKRFMGLGKGSHKKWMASKRKKKAGLVAVFVIVIIVFSAVFFVLFPQPTYLQMIGNMDSKIDKNSTLHVAWTKYTELQYASSNEMMTDYEGVEHGGVLYYTKINIATGQRTTKLISAVSVASVQLVLDSQDHPHIFYQTRNTIWHVEIGPDGPGKPENLGCKGISSFFLVRISGNDTMFALGCNGLTVMYPDGTSWTNDTLWARDAVVDQYDRFHMIRDYYDGKNKTGGMKYTILSGHEVTTKIINISGYKPNSIGLGPIVIEPNGDIIVLISRSISNNGPPSKSEIIIYRFSGNETMTTTLFSADFPPSGASLEMEMFDGKIYGFYSGFERAPAKTFHMFTSVDGTNFNSKDVFFLIRSIVSSGNGEVYGVGFSYGYQSRQTNLANSIRYQLYE